MSKFKNVIVIDDDLFTRTMLKSSLELSGWSVVGEAATAPESIRLLQIKQSQFLYLLMQRKRTSPSHLHPYLTVLMQQQGLTSLSFQQQQLLELWL